jgi:hypothetical protein
VIAGVAQLVEQLIRNQQVRGSSPRAGSKKLKGIQDIILFPFFASISSKPAYQSNFGTVCKPNAYRIGNGIAACPAAISEFFH